MPATTSGYRRTEAGSIITLNDGTTTWTLTSLQPGSLEWDYGGYKPLAFTERGVQQTPYRGDQRSGRLAFKSKYAGSQATDDLMKFLQSQDAAVSTMRTWTIVLKNPTVPYGATGEQLSFALCYLGEGGLKFRSGVEFDEVDVEMPYVGMAPTATTY